MGTVLKVVQFLVTSSIFAYARTYRLAVFLSDRSTATVFVRAGVSCLDFESFAFGLLGLPDIVDYHARNDDTDCQKHQQCEEYEQLVLLDSLHTV